MTVSGVPELGHLTRFYGFFVQGVLIQGHFAHRAQNTLSTALKWAWKTGKKKCGKYCGKIWEKVEESGKLFLIFVPKRESYRR